MRTPHSLPMLLIAALLPSLLTAEELRIADVFTDNAVLQQGVQLPVWGTTTANTDVTIQFAGQSRTVNAAADGTWEVKLAPMQARNTGETMTVTSGQSVREFHNLLIGEVWYASGQSNMQMTLAACGRKIPALAEMVGATRTNKIRWLRIDEADSAEPLTQYK